MCLASNSAMAFGFQLTLMWEGTGEGTVVKCVLNIEINAELIFIF